MKKKTLLIIISIFVGISLLVGLGFVIFSKDNVKTPPVIQEYEYKNFIIEKNSVGKIEPYDKTIYVEGYLGDYTEAYYIKGNMKNTSSKDYGFVLITFKLFDEDNKLLGKAIAGINNVKADSTVEFKAMSITTTEIAKKVVKYELESIKEI